MTLPSPTHWVTVQNPQTKCVHCYQAFGIGHAEAILKAYQDHGWIGTIEARR